MLLLISGLFVNFGLFCLSIFLPQYFNFSWVFCFVFILSASVMCLGPFYNTERFDFKTLQLLCKNRNVSELHSHSYDEVKKM